MSSFSLLFHFVQCYWMLNLTRFPYFWLFSSSLLCRMAKLHWKIVITRTHTHTQATHSQHTQLYSYTNKNKSSIRTISMSSRSNLEISSIPYLSKYPNYMYTMLDCKCSLTTKLWMYSSNLSLGNCLASSKLLPEWNQNKTNNNNTINDSKNNNNGSKQRHRSRPSKQWHQR